MGRHELGDFEWNVIQPHLPSKQRGVPCVDDRRVLNGFWVLRSGAAGHQHDQDRDGPRAIGCDGDLRHGPHRGDVNEGWLGASAQKRPRWQVHLRAMG